MTRYPWMRFLLVLGLFAGLLVQFQSTHADVAPPRWYVERCTMARQQKPGEQCVTCGASWRRRNHCKETYESKGYQWRCRTRGGSVWSEIWCRSEPPLTPPSNQQKSPPQAAPFVVVLTALQINDVRLFKKAFSSAVLNQPGSKDMKKNLREARQKFKKRFGNFQISEFSFSYSGGSSKGKLNISFKGRFQYAMKVVYENGRWKLGEH